MFTVHQLAKSFALNSLFTDITFSINAGDRAGLIGPNGCGKSTLLRIIAGRETADAGHVSSHPGIRIGYLTQGFELDAGTTIAEVVGQASGDVAALESELVVLAQSLASRPDDAVLIAGKGHETYQIIGKKTIDFDDRQEARKALRAVSGL